MTEIQTIDRPFHSGKRLLDWGALAAELKMLPADKAKSLSFTGNSSKLGAFQVTVRAALKRRGLNICVMTLDGKTIAIWENRDRLAANTNGVVTA